MVHLAVDTGTTNTTVWLIETDRILRTVQQPVGVRNTSITGSRTLLHRTLREVFLSLTRKAPSPPRFVLAGGMITSSLGLVEVPHVVAPAGIEELSEHVKAKTFSGISPLSFFLVPGVRIKQAPCKLNEVDCTDVIRGEETEIIGLLARRKTHRPWLFVHLGSHAKAIQIDDQGRIVGSISTLSGECLHVFRTQTILATRLSRLGSIRLRTRFFLRGGRCALRNGLLRALFMVRLLEENAAYGQAELYSFLLGAVVATDRKAFETQGLFKSRKTPILLSGHPDLMEAWRLALRNDHHALQIVHPKERVASFLEGLRQIVFSSPSFRRLSP